MQIKSGNPCTCPAVRLDALALSIVTGISVPRLTELIKGVADATELELQQLAILLSRYDAALRHVHAEMMRERLGAN